jgi:peroxisomal membrane protein 2
MTTSSNTTHQGQTIPTTTTQSASPPPLPPLVTDDTVHDEEQTWLLSSQAQPHIVSYTSSASAGSKDDLANDQKQTSLLSEESPSSTASRNAFQWYANLLHRHPLVVKAITAFFILGLGDAAAQGVEHWQITATATATADATAATTTATTSLDWWRTIRFGSFGLLGAPWAHYYFLFLDTFFPPTEKPFTSTTAIKLFIDQGLQAPSLLAFIIAALAILKGTGFHGVIVDLQAHYINTLIANCTCSCFWVTG